MRRALPAVLLLLVAHTHQRSSLEIQDDAFAAPGNTAVNAVNVTCTHDCYTVMNDTRAVKPDGALTTSAF